MAPVVDRRQAHLYLSLEGFLPDETRCIRLQEAMKFEASAPDADPVAFCPIDGFPTYSKAALDKSKLGRVGGLRRGGQVRQQGQIRLYGQGMVWEMDSFRDIVRGVLVPVCFPGLDQADSAEPVA